MKEVIFRHLNLIEESKEVNIIKNYKENDFFIFGIEITNEKISNLCDYNLDPQHKKKESNTSAIEYLFNNQKEIFNLFKNKEKILFPILKPDIDSVGSAAFLNLFLTNRYELNGDLILRLKAIGSSDRHNRGEWKNNKNFFYSDEYTIFGIPVSLLTMVGSNRLDINVKIKNMEDYLLKGIFDDMDLYLSISHKKLKKAKKNTNYSIIIPNKLIYVESSYRGAIGMGYKKAPIVVAKNNFYKFGNKENFKTGIKYTIAQHEKYINLKKVLDKLNEIENGWGGSSVIIGSPQNKPSIIKDQNLIINIIKSEIEKI